LKALFPLKTCISMYFIPDVLSFCIASVSIFITISCSGLVTLSTQLWREVSLLSRLLYKYNAHSALSLNRLRKLCWHPSSGRFGYTLISIHIYIGNYLMFFSGENDIKLCQIYTKIHIYTILYKSCSIKQFIFNKYATNLKITISHRSLRFLGLLL